MMQCQGKRNNTCGPGGFRGLLFPGQNITGKVLKNHVDLKLPHRPPRGLEDVNRNGWEGLQAKGKRGRGSKQQWVYWRVKKIRACMKECVTGVLSNDTTAEREQILTKKPP